MVTSIQSTSIHKSGAPPGDLAMWVIILAELTVFAILFLSFSIKKSLNLELFSEGQALLDSDIGLMITLALLGASYFVAQAVLSFKRDLRPRCTGFILLGFIAGAVYVALKLWEYSRLIEAGYGLTGHEFFTYYFLITGFHLLHVLLGMGILIYMAIAQRSLTEHGLESGASYWHMVDLVWLLLFPILYLVK